MSLYILIISNKRDSNVKYEPDWAKKKMLNTSDIGLTDGRIDGRIYLSL